MIEKVPPANYLPIKFHLHKWSKWDVEQRKNVKGSHSFESAFQFRSCIICNLKQIKFLWRDL
jgi:hypothetical protein